MRVKDVFEFKPYTSQTGIREGNSEHWMIVTIATRKVLADGFKTRVAAMDFARKYMRRNEL